MNAPEGTSQQLCTWIVKDALPFWVEQGPDFEHGGFVEELNFLGRDAERPYKRTRVTCRQVYVFAHASVLSWSGNHLDLIAHGCDFLTTKAWQGDDLGFARKLTRQGNVLDPTPDLYDHAFALFAFAWAYRATKEPAYKDWAHKTLTYIEAHLRHPSGVGYWHELPPHGWRLQNPHMHLLEASLAAFDTTGDYSFRDRAYEIANLFKNHFFNRRTGTLAEYFADDWSIADDDRGRVAEPGHQFEWAWILQNCKRVLDLGVTEEIAALIKFSETHGINSKTGAVMNVVRDDGTPIDLGSRIWPNTERIKAGVALCDLGHRDRGLQMVQAASRLLLNTYLASSPEITIPDGAWIDAIDGNGQPLAKYIPASTFYHLFLAVAELARIQGAS